MSQNPTTSKSVEYIRKNIHGLSSAQFSLKSLRAIMFYSLLLGYRLLYFDIIRCR